MTVRSFPFYRPDGSADAAEDDYYRLHRESGVISGLDLTLNGLGWSLSTGEAKAGGSMMLVEDTPETGASTPTASGATNPRRDMLVARRTLLPDGGSETVPVLIQGATAVTPADPTPTQETVGVFEEPLFSWQVPGNGGTVITDVRDLRRPLREGGDLAVSIEGTLLRSDGQATLNASGRTNLKTIVAAQSGPWSTYTGPNGIGVQCALPYRYRVNALMTSVINASRMEQLEIEGTRAAVLGVGGGSTTAINGANFGGAGGVIEFDCPSGIQVVFRHYNSGGVAGTIGTTNRFSIEAVRPL